MITYIVYDQRVSVIIFIKSYSIKLNITISYTIKLYTLHIPNDSCREILFAYTPKFMAVVFVQFNIVCGQGDRLRPNGSLLHVNLGSDMEQPEESLLMGSLFLGPSVMGPRKPKN